ncbi:hypothetical protein KGM48_00815 [Patescibacteria group bacterium]|nr:hypothetical protein [Patescibacteria group bacterium]
MRKNVLQFLPVLICATTLGFGEFSRWCVREGNFCYRTVIDQVIPSIIYPAYFFALYTLPIALVLVFVPRPVFKSWLKFAVWAIPLAVIRIAFTPVYPGGMNLFSYVRDDAARDMGFIFMIVSLLVIAFARRGERKLVNKETVNP